MNKGKEKPFRQEIARRNRLALAYLELAGDKTFNSLSQERKNSLLQEVMAIGEEAARQLIQEYRTSDPRKIAGKMGVNIYGEERADLFRSQYRPKKKEIIISRSFHHRLLREVASRELSDRLLKLVVAKELFRHLELDRLGEVYRRYPFVVWQCGPFKREKFVPGLSAVAAQAFTQTLLGLQLTPEVFDYLIILSSLRR